MWQETLAELAQCARGSSLKCFIVGELTSDQRNGALHVLRSAYGRDACRAQRTTRFELPAVPTNIVVIDDLAALSPDDQQALLYWLDRHRDAMVLSFAADPVFPLVTKGTFSERLFYRLNIITLTVDNRAA